MDAQPFPCRRCDRLTFSPDAYVICDRCLTELDGISERDDLRTAPLLATDADRIRHLLDDW